MSIFGERLRAALKMRKMTQQKLAERCGIAYQQISFYCTGRNMPRMYAAIDLADTLQVSLDWLMGGEPALDGTPGANAGQEIRRARMLRGETQGEASRATGVCQSTICMLEKGRNCKIDNLKKMTDHYGLTLDGVTGRR